MTILLQNAFIDGTIKNLLIDNQKISYIGVKSPIADQIINISGKHIIPGVIDPHTHIRDLGQKDKEDWTSASNAALRGGVTTVFDMPNNRPPTINLKNLDLKRKVAELSKINYKFNIATTSYNLVEIVEILETKPTDVSALKLFLAGSNSNEYVGEPEVIKQIFDISLKYNLPVIIHTELQNCVEFYTGKVKNPIVKDHNYIRNRECAIKGTDLVITLAKEIGNKVYIAHTSVKEEIELIRANKNKAKIYCEVTPHHLLLNEDIIEKVGNFGKVNPPIRTNIDNKEIWKGIFDGTVDVIGTDHAPHRLDEKQKPYPIAPSGFPGLETNMPLMLNEVNKGNLSLNQLIKLTSYNSSKIFDLEDTGSLNIGNYADLIVIDMNKEWKIDPKQFKTKAKYSPFEGMSGKGDIEMTFVRGKRLY